MAGPGRPSVYTPELGGRKRVCIYGLTDDKGRVRYIGKANRPKKRYRQHLRQSGRTGNSYRANWLRALHRDGVTPGLRVLERCWEHEWPARERAWIAATDGLVNGSPGGDGPPETKGGPSGWSPIRRTLNALQDHVRFTKRFGGDVEAARARLEEVNAVLERAYQREGRKAARARINASLAESWADKGFGP